MRYLYIFGTIIFTVYGQMMLKWRIGKLGFMLPENGTVADKFIALMRLVLDPLVLSSLFSAVIASLFWMVAMSKFEITQAYPFMSLSPVIVFILGVFVLGETFTIGKLIGLILIILGTIVTVKL